MVLEWPVLLAGKTAVKVLGIMETLGVGTVQPSGGPPGPPGSPRAPEARSFGAQPSKLAPEQTQHLRQRWGNPPPSPAWSHPLWKQQQERAATDLGCLVQNRQPGNGNPGHCGYQSDHPGRASSPHTYKRSPIISAATHSR